MRAAKARSKSSGSIEIRLRTLKVRTGQGAKIRALTR
jgi:hypothetical protein